MSQNSLDLHISFFLRFVFGYVWFYFSVNLVSNENQTRKETAIPFYIFSRIRGKLWDTQLSRIYNQHLLCSYMLQINRFRMYSVVPKRIVFKHPRIGWHWWPTVHLKPSQLINDLLAFKKCYSFEKFYSSLSLSAKKTIWINIIWFISCSSCLSLLYTQLKSFWIKLCALCNLFY